MVERPVDFSREKTPKSPNSWSMCHLFCLLAMTDWCRFQSHQLTAHVSMAQDYSAKSVFELAAAVGPGGHFYCHVSLHFCILLVFAQCRQGSHPVQMQSRWGRARRIRL